MNTHRNIILTSVLALAIGLCGIATSGAADEGGWRCGVATAKITPANKLRIEVTADAASQGASPP